MSKKENKIKGNYGEDIACRFLEKEDYSIITRNFNCSYGEIDIVASKNNEIVFIEVKTRCQTSFGMPVEAIDNSKKIHIYNSAKYFLYKNNLLNKDVRFDVIEILIYDSGSYNINHLKNIIYDEPKRR